MELHCPISSVASREQQDLGQPIQLKEDAPTVSDGETNQTSQVVVLDPDAQCVLSGIERNLTNFNNETVVKQRIMSINKRKI